MPRPVRAGDATIAGKGSGPAHREQQPGAGGRRSLLPGRLARQISQRPRWGVADQGVSSLTNAAVSIYIARTLGGVQFGAFSLAYVTCAIVLNASLGLTTDPLMVRFSVTDTRTWRRAVADCTGTAAAAGITRGCCVLGAATFLDGTALPAFMALGLTLPGLMLQDSWRYSFFALGRGSQALLNDLISAFTLIPALLILRRTGYANVFSFVLAWGATACIGGAVGPLQATGRSPSVRRASVAVTAPGPGPAVSG